MGLYEVLGPFFLAGFTLPKEADDILAFLGIDELDMTCDDGAVVFFGTASFGGQGGALPQLEYKIPSGTVLTWDDYNVPFCLTIPRTPGSQLMPQVLNALTAIGGALTGSGVPDAVDDGNLVLNIRDLVGSLGPQAAMPPAATSDAAGLAFRLEFMVNTLTIHLGDYFRPGKVENGKIVPDPTNPDKDVRILLPKIVFEYTQGDIYTQAPNFRLKSWGQSGFFGIADAQMGELIRMQPDVALYKGGAFGISLGPVILDPSTNNTPPEILSLYGTDEAFTGVYAKKFRIYVNFGERLFSFAVGLDDLLYSINEGWVSLEGDLSVFGPDVNFSIEVQAYEDGAGKEYNPGEVGSTYEDAKPGSLVIKQGSWLQAVMIGGVPPYQSLDVQFKYAAANDTPQSVNLTGQLDATGRNLQLINLPVPYGELVFTATDARNPPHQAVRRIALLAYAQNAVQPGLPALTTVFQRQNALWVAGQNGHRVTHNPSPSGTLEMLEVDSDRTVYDIKAELFHDQNYTQHLATVIPINGGFAVDVPPGKTIYVRVTINEGMANPTLLDEYFDLWFDYEQPGIDEFPTVSEDYADNFTSRPHKQDAMFMATQPPSTADGNVTGQGAELLYDWLTKRVRAQNNEKVIEVIGYASYENDPAKENYNYRLSKRRLAVVYKLIDHYKAANPSPQVTIVSQPLNFTPPTHLDQDNGQDWYQKHARGHKFAAFGQDVHTDKTDVTNTNFYPPNASPGQIRDRNTLDRVVTLKGVVEEPGQLVIEGRLERGLGQSQVPSQSPPPVPAPLPPPPQLAPNEPPTWFRYARLRIRLERSTLVLLEMKLGVDFQTGMEESLANGPISGTPNVKPSPNANPDDGYVDFTASITLDTATNYITYTLSAYAADSDKDGLFSWAAATQNGNYLESNKWLNTLGAMGVLTPIIAQAVGSNNGSAGDWVGMAASFIVPAALANLPSFDNPIWRTMSLTFYGATATMRYFAAPPGQGQDQWSDLGMMFDYGAAFEIHIDALDIHSTRPLKVRYKGVGFNIQPGLAPGESFELQPIFDPTKGYELDLNDPALFNVGGLLGDLVKILGARVSRYNPLTVELDLGLNIDLGFVTVDRILVKWPLVDDSGDGPGIPMILPAGVSVDLPATLKGSGSLYIHDAGFEGQVDITLVPLKIRIAASLAVSQIPDPVTQDNLTALFLGLMVTFPTPIALGASGLGIYGFSGLFAMHYMRTEVSGAEPPIGPALGWLIKAEGEPARLKNSQQEALWAPEAHRWSIGVGAVLGTLDGGFLDNLQGTLMVELPGPRILICTKMRLITALPQISETAELQTGMLGVLDLDFDRGCITLGILLDMTIDKLLELKLPLELFFSWSKPETWHLFAGTHKTPAKANILGIVKGSAYFMISGHGFDGDQFPGGLPGGLVVAGGVSASIIWGSTSIGLYLEIVLRADAAFAFSPLYMVGILSVSGELDLWVVSIGVSASLELRTPPVHFKGEICGYVDLFFFEVEGCVDFAMGTLKSPGYPELLNGMYLQSFAPVIAVGQGGDRPIDASLGNAFMTDDANAAYDASKLPVVPIDSIPALQFAASPLVGAEGEQWPSTLGSISKTSTYTEELKISKGLDNFDGKIRMGDASYSFRLIEVSLEEQTPGSSTWTKVDYLTTPGYELELPPAAWRKEPNAGIELALGTRAPHTFTRALERSTELTTIVAESWKGVCDPIAPPTCVLWTFCGEKLGPSATGWRRKGTAKPDEPGTVRSEEPDVDLDIIEPQFSEYEQLIIDAALQNGDVVPIPAHVIGRLGNSAKEYQANFCARALQIRRLGWMGSGSEVQSTPPGYAEILKALKERLYVDVDIGPARGARLLLAANSYFR